MNLSLQFVQIATGSDDVEGRLVYSDGSLVAVLVHLSDQHDAYAGKWFLEAGFSPINPICPPLFANLDQAQFWIAEQLSLG